MRRMQESGWPLVKTRESHLLLISTVNWRKENFKRLMKTSGHLGNSRAVDKHETPAPWLFSTVTWKSKDQFSNIVRVMYT